MTEIPLPVLKAAWQGFCLDPLELKRILCLCEVYLREENVPFLHFVAVAGGLLTKTLTHTMILLCESLTKEPDGGSAAIPVNDFLTMYHFLAPIDASKDTKYINGYKEGQAPPPESSSEERETLPSLSGAPEDKKLREMSAARFQSQEVPKEGMVAGRQMSTTSGEFIVQHIEKEILAYIDEQIAVLPDPDLKKKQAKPEEVAMIREILEDFLNENMDVIVPEPEEVEEEEQPIPEITIVYAVPGIGGPVDEDSVKEFTEYALDVCKVQSDVLMPRNIRHFLCPPMEKYIEHDYEDNVKKEEVPTSGVITD